MSAPEHQSYAVAKRMFEDLTAHACVLDDEWLALIVEEHKPKPQATRAQIETALGEREERLARLREIELERVKIRADLDQANRALHAARIAASREICAEIKPAYSDAVRKLAAALQAAQDAHDGVLAISEPINADGVLWHDLVPMAAHSIFGAHGERVAEWMRDARAAGYVG